MTVNKPNVLFDCITLVTPLPDESKKGRAIEIIQDAYVCVANGLISYVGKDREKAVQTFTGAEYQIYNGKNKIIWPSMANIHGHIPMTLLRNQTDDHNLHDWLFNVIFPREAKLSYDHVYHGTMIGLAEMIKNGTGAAADMYYYSDAVARAAVEAGFRLNVCRDGKQEGKDGKQHVQIDDISTFKQNWESKYDDLIKTSLLVHSVYLYEPYLYEELAAAAKEQNIFVQVHVSETEKEVEDCLAKYGCRPPEQLDKFGLFDNPSIAAHCVHLNDDDRNLLAKRKVVVAHNPSSNFKLGSGFADIDAMIKAGIKVGLGTDGAASNNNLNLYQEMRLAAFLAKGLTRDASCLPARDLIRMATYNGMQGLGFANTGCILSGWTADLQIVDADRPAMCPLGDADAALVYSSEGNFVESLMVDGCWLMEKRELKTIDEEKAMFEAVRYSKTLI